MKKILLGIIIIGWALGVKAYSEPLCQDTKLKKNLNHSGSKFINL